jgi:hypothetical protein
VTPIARPTSENPATSESPAAALKRLRVVAIDDFPHAELVEHDVRAIFTVEPM